MPNNKILRKSTSVAENSNLFSPRGLKESLHQVSPLQRFVKAKKQISQIFDELTIYLGDAQEYLLESEVSPVFDQETRKDLIEANCFLEQVKGIAEVLGRDHMKVAFFGRTSNGKSTVINAMLKDRILPSGIGHTTNCFVSVHGNEGNDAYMLTPNSSERRNVGSLQQIASALGDKKIDCSSEIQVYWPKERCTLLRDDVVFVDSPGTDVSPDLDSWIDKHCLDADVFVLVVNSESTLNNTEKSFFHKVNSRLSRPNVFILNNRWDASADGDPDMIARVKEQHLQRTTSFLYDELKCVSQQEAIDRVFFISALETLRSRMNQKNLDLNSSQEELKFRGQTTGQGARLLEFEKFELKFQECISKTAIMTKFEGHASRGTAIVTKLREIMEQNIGRAHSQRQWCEAQCQELQDQLHFMDDQFQLVVEEIKDKILGISEEVERHVAKAMSDEIRRLEFLVNDFDYPFHPHHQFLRNYKKELLSYIEKGLGKNLKARCSATLLDSIETYKSAMIDRMRGLLPTDIDNSFVQMTPRRDFEVSYELDVQSLCTDFQEDITFHFSIGWTNLVRKYLAPRNARLAILLGANVKQNFVASTQSQWPVRAQRQSETNLRSIRQSSKEEDTSETALYPHGNDELTMVLFQGFASLTSRTSCGLIVLGALIWRTLGWRLIICLGGGYGLVYGVERARWTNSAKEKCFKKQFSSYASEKLQLVVNFTSINCRHQVQQELSSSFSQLVSEVERAKAKLKEQIESLQNECKRLEELEGKAKVLRNKASWLESATADFMKTFNLERSKI